MLGGEVHFLPKELVKGISECRIWPHLLCTHLVFVGILLHDFLLLPKKSLGSLASKLRLR